MIVRLLFLYLNNQCQRLGRRQMNHKIHYFFSYFAQLITWKNYRKYFEQFVLDKIVADERYGNVCIVPKII